MLPLGNAAGLGIDLYGSTCSGEWYDSAFVGIELLDGNGTPIPGDLGLGIECLGYSAGRSDFSSAGCDGRTISLDWWPNATAIRVASNGGGSGSVSLWAWNYL